MRPDRIKSAVTFFLRWRPLLCYRPQAPAPVAFPMTTPQVPVYGMVRSALSAHLATGREAYFLCSSVSDCILSFSLSLSSAAPRLPPLTSSLLKWIIKWGAFPWCPHSLLCTTSQSWEPPIPLGPFQGHRYRLERTCHPWCVWVQAYEGALLL